MNTCMWPSIQASCCLTGGIKNGGVDPHGRQGPYVIPSSTCPYNLLPYSALSTSKLLPESKPALESSAAPPNLRWQTSLPGMRTILVDDTCSTRIGDESFL